MPNDESLSGVLAAVFEKAKKKGITIEWLADEMGYSPHMLYKALSVNDPSSIPASKIIPFCRSLQDYDLIKFFARHCGYAIFKIPKGMNLKSMTEFQMTLTGGVSSLFRFINNEIGIEEVKAKIDECLGALAGMRRACEKKTERQRDLFEEEEND